MRGSDRLDQLLRAASVLLVVLLFGGTALTKWFMAAFEGDPIGWGDALFFVLQTFTTVGYGELPPFESLPMQALAIVLMVAGVSLVFLVGATLAAHWIEESIAPKPARTTDLRDHIVVTDYNPLVQDLVASFQDEHIPFVVLEGDQERAVELQGEGIPVVLGDPQDVDTLDRAGLDRARGLLASGDDAENIGAILAARNFDEVPVVSRVERLEKARFPALAGADAVVSPEVAMGRALVDWTLAVPTPADWPPPIRVEPGAEAIAELNPSVFHITEGSPLSDATVGDVGESTEALIVGLWRGEQLTFNPDPDTPVLGTAIVALGTEEDIEDLAQLASREGGHDEVVIAGYGNVGAEARDRLVEAGAHVTVIDLEEKDVPDQVVGDATDLEVLREAGVDTADNLILALSDDATALQVALEARVLNPHLHISARATTGRDLRKFRWAGVAHPLSMATVSARMLIQALVREGAADAPFDPLAARRPAGSLAGDVLRAGDVRGRTGCLVLGLVDDDTVRPAHGSEPVHEGTDLLLLGTDEQLARFEEIYLG
jgi:Trk K+ transport system NAD-binding subunit